MATVTHASRSRSRPAEGRGPAVSKARKAAARPKARWAFDGGAGMGGDVAVQAKMEVSQPGDVLEREADRVAEHVVARSPTVPAVARGAGRDDEPMAKVQRMAAPAAANEEETGARVHRMCTDCSAEEEEKGTAKVHRRSQAEMDEKGVHVQRLPQ